MNNMYTIRYGNTKDIRGVTIIRTPTAEMINRINMLQYVAGSFGVAVALTPGYTEKDIDAAATELSKMVIDRCGVV